MTYLIEHKGPYSYVSREPDVGECMRFRGGGYEPPSLVSERNPDVYRYLRCEVPPNYPVPAIDYYNSANPAHAAIGNLMEWSIPVDIQLKFRG